MSQFLQNANKADSEAKARMHSFLVGTFPEHLSKAAKNAANEWEKYANDDDTTGNGKPTEGDANGEDRQVS